jgi:hypothetical protein
VTIKEVTVQMYAGQQRRTGRLTVTVDPDNAEACQALAKRLAGEHGIPAGKAVMRLWTGHKWVWHRAA